MLSNRFQDEDKTYYLMCKDVPVMSFQLTPFSTTKEKILNRDLLPEILVDYSGAGLTNWLSNRSIDLTRSNARLLTKHMGTGMDALKTVIFNKALSLTDCYWIKSSEFETFQELSLYNKNINIDIFSMSLSGIQKSIIKAPNTELTNIGSYEKAWTKIDEDWWLVKHGSIKNIFAELFTFFLARRLGLPVALYKLYDSKYITTKNFTNTSLSLEHYHSLKYKFNNRDLDDVIIYDNLDMIFLGDDYLNILLLDAIVCNPDRHEFNFGVLRDPNYGHIKGLAPNFDNNLALGAQSGLSTFLLKSYLNTFGIRDHQKTIRETLNIRLIESTLSLTMSHVPITMDYADEILRYFKEIIDLLDNH